jgi:hypothetical protein
VGRPAARGPSGGTWAVRGYLGRPPVLGPSGGTWAVQPSRANAFEATKRSKGKCSKGKVNNSKPGLPANSAIEHFADEVGVAVVAGIVLGHVGVYPTEGNGLAPTQTGVVEAMARRSLAARFALGLPDG